MKKSKCSKCGKVFEFECNEKYCTPSEEAKQHIKEHNIKGEKIHFIVV